MTIRMKNILRVGSVSTFQRNHMGLHSRRDELLRSYVRDKYVLDLGSLNHGNETDVFNLVKKYANITVGLDTLPSNRPGIIKGDAQRLRFREEFDVIVAGEIIEHLDDTKGFLKGASRALKKDGRLIITTPNCLSPYWWINRSPNPEHVLWHDMNTIRELLQRYGFEIIFADYYSRETKTFQGWLFKWFRGKFPILNLHLFVVAGKGK